MRTSRLLVQRLVMLEALLRDAKTEVDRLRIMQAIKTVRGRQRSHAWNHQFHAVKGGAA